MIARHGLTEVYAPPEGTETVALIIFVHGLFGNPHRTWASKPSKARSRSPRTHSVGPSSSSQVSQSSFESRRASKEKLGDSVDGTTFWPRDLLPYTIPEARVFTWGYDADIDGFSSASQSTIHQHAGSLLSDIANQRETGDDYKKPIAFVVHSLGGIIVKAALNVSSATEGTRLKEIAPATFGICFLGTPHRGSKSASLGKVAYQITVAATRSPNTRLLQGLERNSQTLEQVGDAFAQTMLKRGGQLRIYSFREEKETRRYLIFNTMVVEADSAKIGDAHEEVGSIPANHSNMTKFESREDIGFKRVSAQLRRWVHELRADKTISQEDIGDCMASLESAETKFRIGDVRKTHKTTFHWLFDPSIVSFTEWLADKSDAPKPFYWIQGKPGSGKSTLMKFAFSDTRTLDLLGRDSEPPWTFVAFFFHDRGTSMLHNSLVGMLREITSSILKELPQLLPLAVAISKKLVKAQRKKTPEWGLDDLVALMHQIVAQRDTRIRLLLFLDALDEHSGDNDQLVQMLQEWRQSADGYYVNLKVCLASRSWPIFEDYFGHGPNLAIDHHTKHDICVYTESRLNSLAKGPSRVVDSKSLAELSEQITRKAQGVFIWVRLVTDRLARTIRDGTLHETLEKMVAELPEELKDLYDHTVVRINPEYTNETHVILQLVLCSLEPLTLGTLISAARYGLNLYLSGDASDERLSTTSLAQKLRWLMSRSGGLLDTYTVDDKETVEQGTASLQHVEPYVQFLHQTAKEYVQSFRAQAVMERIAAPVAKKNGFYFLALCSQSCAPWVPPIKIHSLQYLKLVETSGQFDAHMKLPVKFEMAEVSASDAVGTPWRAQQHKAPVFEKYDSSLGRQPDSIFDQTSGWHDYYGLTIMVAANLMSLVKETLNPALLSFITTTSATSGESKMEYCLLQVAIGAPSLIPAHLVDREAMVQTLLSLQYPSNFEHIPQDFYWDPEKSLGRRKVLPRLSPLAILLVRCGETQPSEDTRLAIAKLLLDSGADPYAPFPRLAYTIPNKVGTIQDGISLLSYSAQHESAAMVRLLLQYSANSNWPDNEGWLPVDYAIIRQDREVLAAFTNHHSFTPLRPTKFAVRFGVNDTTEIRYLLLPTEKPKKNDGVSESERSESDESNGSGESNGSSRNEQVFGNR
ncbi:MAG: hypothetical protein Q9218_007015 [Villophora microphyllina]